VVLAFSKNIVEPVLFAIKRFAPALANSLELDIDLIRNIQASTGVRMEPLEEAPEEKDVLVELNKVIAAKRAASMSLHDSKFGERADHNRRKWKKASD